PVELLALLAVKLFGVLEAGAGECADAFGKDDGGGDDRAEERAAANLVDTGDGAVAVVAQGLLGRVGADELLEETQLRGGGGDFRIEFVSAAGHCELECSARGGVGI